MRAIRLVATLLCAAGVGGCGEDSEPRPERPREVVEASVSGDVETARLPDRPDDVEARIGASEPPRPPEPQLDLLSVELRRDSETLRVTFVTAAPPGPGTIQRLIAYDDQLRSRTTIEVERPREGGVRGLVTPSNRVARRVSAESAGTRTTVEAPLDELTRARRFKWRARSLSGSPLEVDDRAPSRVGDYRTFPR